MKEILDKFVDSKADMGNDFLASAGASLFLKVAKWAKIFAIFSLFALTLGLVYTLNTFKDGITTQFGGFDTLKFFRSMIFLIIQIIKFTPIIYILIFSNRFTKAYKNNSSIMAYNSLKSLNFYFIFSLIVLALTQLLSFGSIYLYPILVGTAGS